MSDAAATTELVERPARIFRFGTFPGRNGWECSREQFIAANGERGTVPIGIDPVGKAHYHGRESWLDGETGFADFEVHDDAVHATLRLPAWLDRIRAKVGGISGVFGRADRVLRKVDMVARPHVPDAVLLADGDEVHVFADANDDEPVELCDERAREVAQEQHELLAAHHPGLCDGSVAFAEDTEDRRTIRQAHDHAISCGAYCPGMLGHDTEGEIEMADDERDIDFDRLVLLADGQIAEDEQYTSLSGRDRQLVDQAREIRRLRDEAIHREAVAFADEMTTGKDARALPFQRATIVHGYKVAAKVPASDVIEFADAAGKTHSGTHLDAFKAGYKALPPHNVTREKIAGTGVVELGEEVSDASRAAAEKAREAEKADNLAFLERHTRKA